VDVDIWSDIACPWCYIGKRRLEAALARFEHADEVSVHWHSFELDPRAPAERTGNRTEALARKYGTTIEHARAAEQRLAQTAAEEGLDFHFDRARSGNTFDGHRLVHLAATHGLAGAMKERLLAAYFSEGRLISDPATLAELAAEVGLPEADTAELLATERFAEEVRADELLASQLRISGVPTFIVDRVIGVSGAQPPDELLALLREGWGRAAAPALATPEPG
jgi:predicted DsbA family dithiol-disulfide isomerase